MDIYIRSQDKTMLIKFERICVEESKDIDDKTHFEIVCGSAFVGEYETKERCIEIINAIQSIIWHAKFPYVFDMPKE